MAITTFLDPAQLPARSQDQAAFDALMALFMQNLPTFAAQVNATAAAFNAAAAGGAFAIPYTFDSTSTAMADPGTGKLRLNNYASQSSSTGMALSATSAGAQDVSALIDTVTASTSTVKGQLRLVKVNDLTKWITFNVTLGGSGSAYRTITCSVTASSSAAPFINGDSLVLFFQRTGDKGDTGVNVFPTLIVQESSSAGAAAMTLASGVNTRRLNTVVKNTISGASLSSYQLTLPAGTYRVRGSVPAVLAGSHKAVLESVPGSGTVAVGTSESTTSSVVTRSIIDTEIYLGSQTVLELRTYANTAGSGGVAATSGSFGETFSTIIFEKVS